MSDTRKFLVWCKRPKTWTLHGANNLCTLLMRTLTLGGETKTLESAEQRLLASNRVGWMTQFPDLLANEWCSLNGYKEANSPKGLPWTTQNDSTNGEAVAHDICRLNNVAWIYHRLEHVQLGTSLFSFARSPARTLAFLLGSMSLRQPSGRLLAQMSLTKCPWPNHWPMVSRSPRIRSSVMCQGSMTSLGPTSIISSLTNQTITTNACFLLPNPNRCH